MTDTSRLTATDLAVIRARLAAAGDVDWDTYGKSFVYDEGGRGICVADCCGDSDRADFIAAAPTDIAALLRECEALTIECDMARTEVRGWEYRVAEAANVVESQETRIEALQQELVSREALHRSNALRALRGERC